MRNAKRVTLWLWLLFSTGIIVIIAGNSLEQEHIWLPIIGMTIRDTGIAILVAAIIALTVESRLLSEAISDVAKAALGYLLPEAIRTELEWVFEQHIIYENYHHTYNVVEIGNDCMEVRESIYYDLTNHSRSSKPFTIKVETEEWRVPGHPSRISVLAYSQNGKRTELSQAELQRRVRSNNAAISVEQKIPLKPKERVGVWVEWITYRHYNDLVVLVLRCPTTNPQITVNVPHRFDFDILTPAWACKPGSGEPRL